MAADERRKTDRAVPLDWLAPGVLLAFLVSLLLAAALVWFVEKARRHSAEDQGRHLASAVAHDLGERLDRSLSASYALATLVRQGKGRIDNFETLGAEMIRVYGGITALQLAPGGTIQQVVPLVGNESVIGFSPLNDPLQGPEARRVIEQRQLGLTGPLELKQGGVGVVGRHPIFMPDEHGGEQFWGLTQVLIRIPDLLAATRLSALVEGGYAYELWRIRPDGTRHVFSRAGDDALVSPVEIPISVPNGRWVLSIVPVGGWVSTQFLAFSLLAALAFSLLTTFAVYLLLRQPRLLQQEVSRRTEQLRASEVQYRALFDSNPVPMVVYELRRQYLLDANKAFLSGYGFSRQELLQRRFCSLHPESERDRLVTHLSTLSPNGTQHWGEWHHTRNDGRLIDVDITSLDVSFEGRPAALVLAIDITDRKRAEEAVKTHNTWLKSVLTHFPGGVSVADAQMRIVEWNEQFRKLLDFPREMFDGAPRTLLDFIRYNAARGEYGNVDVDAHVAQAAARMNMHEAHHFERTRPDGTVLEVRGTPLPDGGFISSYTDITERKRDEARLLAANQRYEELNADLEMRVAERTQRLATEVEERRQAESAVRRSAEWLREIIDTMSIGILLWDKDQHLVAWNDAFKRLYPASADLLREGFARDELRQGMELRGDVPAQSDESRDWNRQGQWDRILPDGRVVSVERMMTSEGGRLVLQTDVTALRRTAEVLARNERMASLGNLVAGIAHEINTPIGNARMVASAVGNSIAEFEEALASGPLRRSVLETFLANVRESDDLLERNLVRAANLIQNFKQVAVDQTSDQRRPFDLATVLEEIQMTLLPRFKHSPFRLELDAEVGVSLDSFPGALGQVVTNLVENALVHAFESRSEGRVLLQARGLEGDRVEIVCADSGTGIPADLRPRIFDPFFTTKLGKGGSGLGLSIVLNLVRNLLGGDMIVESDPGEGTRFIITLPRVARNDKSSANETSGGS
ncbi:MAG: PAS-domain containing protein [Betaproteobacteria bacterium]|nr:PAS-domain containing protein [Betaproteobacteria bacterium]